MLIGRIKEKDELLDAYNSEYSEFVAITGRRRIGKTFLVRETFNYKFTFQHTGLANQKTRVQLKEFHNSLLRSGMRKCRVPSDWSEAFSLLADFLDNIKKEKKKIVFIDELPWMDAPRSSFVSSLEHFWNGYASARKDILLIICGSATSWIINKVYRSYGGLHNRVSHRINLFPFSLHECEDLMRSRHIQLSRYDLLEYYMVMGGVPFYWTLIEKGKSVSQNIDSLFFNPRGKLHNEYKELYMSLFKNPSPYIKIISLLGKIQIGKTRDQLIREGDFTSNGDFSSMLEELEECGFIRKYFYRGIKNYSTIYQLIDNFTLFHYKFLEKKRAEENFWQTHINSPIRNSWEGFAFERVCFEHIKQIKQALGISGISTTEYSWRVKEDEVLGEGAQIDLVIERPDNVVNLCEAKFSYQPFGITKKEEGKLRHRLFRFKENMKSNTSINWTLISPFGLRPNAYQNVVQNVITVDDLFKE